MAVVNSLNLKENYNSVVEGLASEAFQEVVKYFEGLVDEMAASIIIL